MAHSISSLSPEELERYSRQIMISEVGVEGQRKLKESRVLLVGIGGLGSPLSMYLAASGIGTLGLVEYDSVDLSNLHRQILYATQDVGVSKAAVAKAKLSDLNSHIKVVCHEEKLTLENAVSILNNYDIIVDGTDNFYSRYLINDFCISLEKPLVYGSVSMWTGQVSVVLPGQGPCYRCMFPMSPALGAVPTCSEGGVLGVIPGVIAMLQATEVIKLILNAGTSLAGRVVYFDGLKMAFREFSLRKDPMCTACGATSTLSELIQGFEEITAEQLEKMLNSEGKFELLDVREPHEFSVARLTGARLIPLRELSERFSELNLMLPVVVYCKSGQRSRIASEFLFQKGFSRVMNLEGGIDQYKKLDSIQKIQ
jgi:adenylyltransferase/sulfurtransferase